MTAVPTVPVAGRPALVRHVRMRYDPKRERHVLLAPESVVLDADDRTRDEAITRAGELLVEAGAVDAAYVEGMHAREASVSTYMGNGLALPHGTNEAKSAIKRTAISFVRYSDGLDWKGKEVKFVVGVAALLGGAHGGALNLWLNQRRPGGDARHHWHIDLVPRVAVVGGCELATGLVAVAGSPRDDAARLRALDQSGAGSRTTPATR